MIIPSSLSQRRIDQFYAQHRGISRNSAQKYIAKQQVLVNGQPVKPSYLLQEGDQVTVLEGVPIASEVSTVLKPENIPLDILYEDNAILVINKPVGLTVHPVHANHAGTLVQALLHHTTALSDCGPAYRPGIVHRLDKDTEGVMVISKTNDAYRNLSAQFKNRHVIKKYYAVVKGNITEDFFVIDLPIARHQSKRTKMAVVKADVPQAKHASTIVRVLKRYNTKTLLDIQIETGRTHQIRVHLAYIGNPVLRDPLYAKKKNREDRQLLQAYYLSFLHPITGKSVAFEVPLSDRLLQ